MAASTIKIRLPLPSAVPAPKICVMGPGSDAFFAKLFRRESTNRATISAPRLYELEDGSLYELVTSMSENGHEPMLQDVIEKAAAVIVTCIGADHYARDRASALCHAVADITSTAPLFIVCLPRSDDRDNVARAFEEEIAANLGRVLTLAGFFVVRTKVDAAYIILVINKHLKNLYDQPAVSSSSSSSATAAASAVHPSPSGSSGSPPLSTTSSPGRSPRSPPPSPSDSPRCALQ